MKFLYLFVDFFTVLIPLVFSFHPKIQFYKRWKAFFIAAFIAAVIFITWDTIFTSLQVWNFNKNYITGIYFLNLPIEEILFFICIPFSCVFTFYCLNKFYELSWNSKAETIFLPHPFRILIHNRISFFEQNLYFCYFYQHRFYLCSFKIRF